MDYTTLVFKNLNDAPFGHTYIMTVVYPNWQSRIPKINEIGYLEYRECIAGQDKWYDKETNQFIPYNYTNLVFIKFVKENKDNSNKDIII